MTCAPHSLRVLLLVLGLGAVSLASVAGAEPTAAAVGSEGVIYPRNAPEAQTRGVSGESSSVWGVLGVIAILGGAGLYLLKRGQLGPRSRPAAAQRLSIEETRPIGNKQFLAVAAYGDRRILLGICPGRVDFLCRLDDGAVNAPVSATDAAGRAVES